MEFHLSFPVCHSGPQKPRVLRYCWIKQNGSETLAHHAGDLLYLQKIQVLSRVLIFLVFTTPCATPIENEQPDLSHP